MKKKKQGWFITFIVLDIFSIIGLFLIYGPFSFFQDFWISSAMTTMTHQYFAKVFYSDEVIEKSLKKNYVVESDENTDASQIKFTEIVETEEYESIYEEQILKKNEGNDLYKVIDIEGSNWKGHMVAIYDSSKVSLVQSSKINVGGQGLDNLAKSKGANVAINASGFKVLSSGAIHIKGAVIMNGKLVSNYYPSRNNRGLVGFNKDGVLMLTKDDPKDAIADGMIYGMSFGPFLVVNGKMATMSGDGGWGIAPRTAIAQRQDGIVLFVVIDGRRPGHSIGISMKALAELFMKYKAYNASNLDGGGSSTLYADGEILSVAGGYGYTGNRYLPNAWIVKK